MVISDDDDGHRHRPHLLIFTITARRLQSRTSVRDVFLPAVPDASVLKNQSTQRPTTASPNTLKCWHA